MTAAFLAHLREVVAIEIGVSAFGGIGQVNIGQPPAAQLIHFAAVVFDPIQIAQRDFAFDRDHGDFARSEPSGLGPTRSTTDFPAVSSKKL